MKSTEVDQGLFTDSYCKVCSAQLISESQRVAHYEVKTPPPPPHITPHTHTTLTHHTLMKLMKGSGVAPFFRLYLGRRSARPIHLSPAAYTPSINTQHHLSLPTYFLISLQSRTTMEHLVMTAMEF